jgi:hypothetical protein
MEEFIDCNPREQNMVKEPKENIRWKILSSSRLMDDNVVQEKQNKYIKYI